MEQRYIILVKNEPYFSGYTRVIAAFLVSVLLIKLSTHTSFNDLLSMKRFYLSLVFGFVLALSVIEMLHWCNVLLDLFCSWQRHRKKRFVLQVLGVTPLVLYFNVVLVRAACLILNNSFDKSEFISKILPVNILLVLITHILFFFRRYDGILFSPLKWYKKLIKKDKVDLFADFEMVYTESNGQTPLSGLDMPGPKLLAAPMPVLQIASPVAPETPAYWRVIEGFIQSAKYTFSLNEVLFISTGAVYGDIYLKRGHVCNMNYKGNALRKYLDPAQFAEVRAGVFYALNAIEAVRKEGKTRSLILKPEYRNDIPALISRRYFEHFMICFKKYQEQQVSVDYFTRGYKSHP